MKMCCKVYKLTEKINKQKKNQEEKDDNIRIISDKCSSQITIHIIRMY